MLGIWRISAHNLPDVPRAVLLLLAIISSDIAIAGPFAPLPADSLAAEPPPPIPATPAEAASDPARLSDRVRLVTADGFALTAALYRTKAPQSEADAPLTPRSPRSDLATRAAIFFAPPGESDTVHAPLAAELAKAGIPILALTLRDAANSGRTRRDDPTAYWRDGLAGLQLLADSVGVTSDRVVLIGEGLGAWAAIWTASRSPEAPAGFILLEPVINSERGEGVPILRGLERPCLVVASEELLVPFDSARTIFTAGDFPSSFWQVAGASRVRESLWRRPATVEEFAADLAHWISALTIEEPAAEPESAPESDHGEARP